MSPSSLGAQGGWSQKESPTGTPTLPAPPTHIDAILAWLPRWPRGARGAPRSHFLKWRNVIRRCPPTLSHAVGPPGGTRASRKEHPLFLGPEQPWGLPQGLTMPPPRPPEPLAQAVRPGGAVPAPQGVAGNKGDLVRIPGGRCSAGGGLRPRGDRAAPWAHPRGVLVSTGAQPAISTPHPKGRQVMGQGGSQAPPGPGGEGLLPPGCATPRLPQSPGPLPGAADLPCQRSAPCAGSPAPWLPSWPGAARAAAGPGWGLRPWLQSHSERTAAQRRGGQAGGAGGGWTPGPALAAAAQAPHSAGPTWAGGGFRTARRLPAEPARGKKETQWHFLASL